MDLRLGTTTHDLEVDAITFDLTFVDGREYYAQKLKVRLWFFLGEWFLDTSEGTPWFQSILVKTPNLTLIGALLKARILESPGVQELVSFDMQFDRALRSLVVSFQAKTDAGTVEISEAFP